MEALFTEMTGEDYGWFFEQWLYKAGYPECKIECSHDETLRHALVKIEQTQKHDDSMTPEVFKFPLTVEFACEDGKLTRYTMQVNERIHSFYYPIKKKPKQILVDPDYAVLMDWDITKPEAMWIEQLKHGKTIMQRIKAAQALGKKANQKSLEALGRALVEDPFWGVQAQIAKVLGTVKNNTALEHLLKGVDLKDSRARTAVARALGNFFRNDEALGALEILLKDNDSFFVVSSAAASIGKLKHTRSFGILKTGLKDAPETWTEIVRSGYLSGLKETGKEEAISIIKEYVKPGHDDYLRRAAPGLLAFLGKKHKKKHPEVKDVIEGLFHDKSYKVQLNAINAAKNYGDSTLIGSLTKLAEGQVDADIVRLARLAIRALSKKKDSTEVKSLQKSVEELEKENRNLKDRLSKVEAILDKEDE
jgi:aminopeptidase N